MFLTSFALAVVATIVILFIVRSWKKNKMSQQEIKKEEKEGIMDQAQQNFISVFFCKCLSGRISTSGSINLNHLPTKFQKSVLQYSSHFPSIKQIRVKYFFLFVKFLRLYVNFTLLLRKNTKPCLINYSSPIHSKRSAGSYLFPLSF